MDWLSTMATLLSRSGVDTAASILPAVRRAPVTSRFESLVCEPKLLTRSEPTLPVPSMIEVRALTPWMLTATLIGGRGFLTAMRSAGRVIVFGPAVAFESVSAPLSVQSFAVALQPVRLVSPPLSTANVSADADPAALNSTVREASIVGMGW
jgi:hypothetical protein